MDLQTPALLVCTRFCQLGDHEDVRVCHIGMLYLHIHRSCGSGILVEATVCVG